MTEKALIIFQKSPDYEINYVLEEGKYIYDRNGKIQRIDKAKPANTQNVLPQNAENTDENSGTDARRGRKPKDTNYTNSITNNSLEYITENLIDTSNES